MLRILVVKQMNGFSCRELTFHLTDYAAIEPSASWHYRQGADEIGAHSNLKTLTDREPLRFHRGNPSAVQPSSARPFT